MSMFTYARFLYRLNRVSHGMAKSAFLAIRRAIETTPF